MTNASFLDLFDDALKRCIVMLGDVYLVLSGQAPVEGLASRLGEESLDTGRENCTPVHSKPLPLREIMDELYRKMGAEAESDRS